jgi:hypothetical protein
MTIKDTTDPLTAMWFALSQGTFRIRMRQDGLSGEVLDDDDNVIGSASTYLYGSRGFSVHTRPFAGFVSRDQVQLIGGSE